MRIFGLNILTDKRLAAERTKAREIPNKMISVMMSKKSSQGMIKDLIQANQMLQSENEFLREKVRNA